MAASEKTHKKSLPPHLIPGNPGNSGGKKGRSGRKSYAFLQRCLEATEDEELWKLARRKTPFSLLDMAAGYAHGKPAQPVKHTVGGEVKVVVQRETKRDPA